MSVHERRPSGRLQLADGGKDALLHRIGHELRVGAVPRASGASAAFCARRPLGGAVSARADRSHADASARVKVGPSGEPIGAGEQAASTAALATAATTSRMHLT
jgi:hypothetical protein